MMKKKNALVAIVLSASAIGVAEWFAVPERQDDLRALPPEKPIAAKPAPEMQAAAAPLPGKPTEVAMAKPVHPKRHAGRHAHHPIKIGKLLVEDDGAAGAGAKPETLSRAMVARDADGVDIDLGNKLPWPVPDSPWLPKNKDLGFHVGVDYHLSDRLDLTGIAGVRVPGGVDAYPMKPNVEQIGIRARYRF